MEFKGTKGEWFIKKEDLKTVMQQGNICIRSTQENRNWIAEALYNHVNKGMDLTELKANALLISKAPEMLDMLQKVNDSFLNDSATIEQIKLRNKIEKLIKKATKI